MRIAFSSLLIATLAATAAPSAPSSRRDVDFAAADGTKLKATVFSADAPGPGIVLLHECEGAGRTSWTTLATRLAAAGIHVLTVDYRGFGDSGGARFEGLDASARRVAQEKWPGDLDVAFDFLRAQPGVERTRIAAGGASCGVAQAVQLAVRHPEVRALVLLSGPTDQAGLEHLQRSPRLQLFTAASADDYGFVPYLRWLRLFSRGTMNESVEYQKAGHGTTMLSAEVGLVPRIVDWLGRAVGPSAEALTSAETAQPAAHPAVEFWSILSAPGGSARASQLLKEAKQRNPNAELVPELALLLLGSERLRSGNARAAGELFQFGTEAYPTSALAWHYLATAQAEAGDAEAAVTSTRRTLALLEHDRELEAETRQLIRERAAERLERLAPGGEE